MPTYSLFDVGACNCAVPCLNCGTCSGANCIPEVNLTLTWAYTGGFSGTEPLIFNGVNHWSTAYFPVSTFWFVFVWGCFSGNLDAQLQESATNGGVIAFTCGPPLGAVSFQCNPPHFGYNSRTSCSGGHGGLFTTLTVTL